MKRRARLTERAVQVRRARIKEENQYKIGLGLYKRLSLEGGPRRAPDHKVEFIQRC